MKLIIAIVMDEDSNKVLHALNKKGFSVTKLATTGGFLRSGNVTFLIGTEEERVDDALEILKTVCKRRQDIVMPNTTTFGLPDMAGGFNTITVGGATIFVLSVDRFEKL